VGMVRNFRTLHDRLFYKGCSTNLTAKWSLVEKQSIFCWK